MRRSMAVRWASMAMCAAVGLLPAALSARPAGAQEFGFAAVAVSPSTLKCGSAKGTTTQASVAGLAVQECQMSGARDCKAYSVLNGCVAVATSTKLIPNYYGYSVGTTREGAAAQALAACANEGAGGIDCWVQESPCSSDDVRWASPLPLPAGGKPGSVDPGLVGLWEYNANPGIWVWQISVNGTYTFHTEAPGYALPHNGTFTASNGKYTLHAVTAQWDDLGTYTFPSSGVMVTIGKAGTDTWYRIAADPGYPGPASKR